MNKVLLVIFVISTFVKSEVLVTQDMIYGGISEVIKGIPENISNLGNYIYKTEIKKEKNYWWYFKKNQKLKTELKKRMIDYHTLLKQGMYPVKVYDNSKKSEIKKYAILTALAQKNGIKTESIEEKIIYKKKKLKIEMIDISKQNKD